jgi:hypothetical protein
VLSFFFNRHSIAVVQELIGGSGEEAVFGPRKLFERSRVQGKLSFPFQSLPCITSKRVKVREESCFLNDAFFEPFHIFFVDLRVPSIDRISVVLNGYCLTATVAVP